MRLFEGHWDGTRVGWFRVLGVGLAWADHRKAPPYFSERYAGQYGIPRRRFLHIRNRCVSLTTRRHP